ncbi:hypothetical protein GUJ93_ZPchr0002g25954 [Zizania palustris]|uniref:Uncharacterized protein n=1 Tax=Zizania palustris TaxID=103762 RepID=A0A8J5S2V6_ZIZPA|nr:hypothetical protein GUJ93_ZPchr0002g25954 [Zizania palustris]
MFSSPRPISPTAHPFFPTAPRFFRSPAFLPCLCASRSPPPHLSPPSAHRSPPATPPPPPPPPPPLHLSPFLRALVPPVRGPCLLSWPIRVAPSPLTALAAPRRHRRSSSPSPECSGSKLSTAPATAGGDGAEAPEWKKLSAKRFGIKDSMIPDKAWNVLHRLRSRASTSFQEDCGRILRAIRIAAHLSFNFPKETAYHVRTLACSVARLDKVQPWSP